MFKFLSGLAIFAVGIVLGALLTAYTPLGDFLRPSTVSVTATFIPIVDRITELREITTVRFNYANIVTSSVEMPRILNALYGEEQVMVAVGHIEAGIDMSQIDAESLVFDEETNILQVNIPGPMIQSCFLNENESYVVSRTSGIFAASSPQLDVESRRFALEQARIRAVEDDILGVAQEEAEVALTEFITPFVDASITVNINVDAPDPNAPLPDTCP